jgi:hypothetical protein
MNPDFKPFKELAFLIVLAVIVSTVALGGGIMWWLQR